MAYAATSSIHLWISHAGVPVGAIYLWRVEAKQRMIDWCASNCNMYVFRSGRKYGLGTSSPTGLSNLISGHLI